MEVDSRGEMKDGGVLGFPYWVAARRKLEPHDPFFMAGNHEREFLAKQVALDLTEDEKSQLQSIEDVEGQAVFCPIAGCGAQLKTLNDFEDHYHARHTASCSVCTRVFPTSRLLSMHVSEAHDSFFQAKVARGFPMVNLVPSLATNCYLTFFLYECLVEGCGVKLKSYESRQQHLVDKHKFPTTFEFFKKAHPSKKQRQKYQNKQTAHQRLDSKNMAMDVEGQASGEQQYQKYQVKRTGQSRGETKERHMEVEEKMDDLVSAVSRLSTSDSTPSTISFGRRHARGIQFLPRSIQRSKKSVSSADGKG